MNWLVTGGCGFIGANLIKNLMEEGGHFVRVVDNFSVGTPEDLASVCSFIESDPQSIQQEVPANVVELIQGDILDENLAMTISRGMDVIVHLAANTGVAPSVKDPRFDCAVNVIGTLNYLEAARHNGIKRFVFASSGAPVGECKPPIHEEMAPHPVSPYGASKLAGEAYCSAYYRTFGVETVALRFGNVYGPYSAKKDSVVAKFIKQIIEGRALVIYGNGDQTRDFIYIDDLTRSIRLATSTKKASGETFQIATACETTVREMTDVLIKIYKEFKNNDVRINFSEPRLGDVEKNFSDTSKAKNILHWQPDVVLETGLRKTVSWFLQGIV